MKAKIEIEIPGDNRKGKCWAKTITSIDYTKKDGYMFEGDFLREGETLLEEGTVILYVGHFGSWKNGEQLAGICQIQNGKEEIIVSQNEKWAKSKISLAEKCEELLGKTTNGYQVDTIKIDANQKHKPIIWDKESKDSMEEFFQIAKGLNMDYVIYVQDSRGDDKSAWACAKEDFTECMFTFSNKCYFGRVQSLDMAIRYGFFDEVKDN